MQGGSPIFARLGEEGGRGDGTAHRLGRGDGFTGGEPGKDRDKLITSIACEGGAGTGDEPADELSDLRNDLAADEMAVRIDHRLEAIEVEEDQAQLVIFFLASLELDAELVVKESVVAESREVVAPGRLAMVEGVGEIEKGIRGVAREHFEELAILLAETLVAEPVEEPDHTHGLSRDRDRHSEESAGGVVGEIVESGIEVAVFPGGVVKLGAPLAKDPAGDALRDGQASPDDDPGSASEGGDVDEGLVAARDS